ncbi:MAG: S53 family peptidase [Mycobacteriaceae bacterium]
MKSVRHLTLVAALGLAAAALPATLASAAPGLTGFGLPSLTVTRNLLPGLANASDLGVAPAAHVLNLQVTLPRPNPSGEQALIDAEHTPGNPVYGQFLSVDDFAARFGVPQSKVDQTTSWLTGGGLTVASVSAARDQLTVSGTIAQIDSLMKTSTRSFTSNGVAFVANTAAPVVPVSLGITNIVGLNTLQRMSVPARTPSQDTCQAGNCTGSTTPKDLWSVYQQPEAWQGQGQKIAVFGAGRTDDVISDLRTFETKFGLPQVPTTVVHPQGQTGFTDDSGLQEWNIDTQASTGMAPKADELRLYFGSDLSDASVGAMMSTWANDPTGPMQANASFGECETVPIVSPIVAAVTGTPLLNPALPVGLGLGNNSDATFNQILSQAAIEGRTLFSSTGDTGSSCPVVYAAIIGAGNGVLNQVVPITNSPADLPNVVGVGGTVLYTDGAGRRTREYGWAYSGGGSTLFTTAPSYQQGTPGLSIPCITDPTKVCRGISDVSAQSGDVLTNGYSIISGGQAANGGGTSLSSPLWAGMWTRVQSASSAAKGNGFANYSLYRVGKDPVTYARDFFDVSSTDVATGLPASNGAYFTQPGWDYVTGFGTPKVSGLICDIDHLGC